MYLLVDECELARSFDNALSCAMARRPNLGSAYRNRSSSWLVHSVRVTLREDVLDLLPDFVLGRHGANSIRLAVQCLPEIVNSVRQQWIPTSLLSPIGDDIVPGSRSHDLMAPGVPESRVC